MMQPAVVERVRQRPHHVVLTDQRREVTRAPFASQYLMCHAVKRRVIREAFAIPPVPDRPGGVVRRRWASRDPGTRGE